MADRKFSGVRAGEDPKGSDGRAGEDPKGSDGRAGEDPKGSDGRGGGANAASFGGAGGWGVVAFIGPVGLNIPELALRALRGETAAGSHSGGRRANALSKLHTIAQKEARKETRQRTKPGAYAPTEKLVKD